MSEPEIPEWVARAADLLSGPDADAAADVLVSEGCDPDLAVVVTDTLPSAFAEPILAEKGVLRVETYTRRLTDGQSVIVAWDDDPVWIAASNFVAETRENGRWHQFKHIADSSAELDSLSRAEASGKNLRGAATATAPIYRLPPDSSLLPQKVRKPPPSP